MVLGRLLLAVCCLAALGGLPRLWSYSTAIINNAAAVRITPDKDALIAVHLADYEVCFPGNEIYGKVVNNMSKAATLHNLPGADEVKHLLPSTSAELVITAVASGRYSGEIVASWMGGEAKVPYSISLNVVDPATLTVDWDIVQQAGTISNASGYDLLVTVNGESSALPAGETLTFGRAGDEATIVFYLGANPDRKYETSIATPVPPPASAELLGDEDVPTESAQDLSDQENSSFTPGP